MQIRRFNSEIKRHLITSSHACENVADGECTDDQARHAGPFNPQSLGNLKHGSIASFDHPKDPPRERETDMDQIRCTAGRKKKGGGEHSKKAMSSSVLNSIETRHLLIILLCSTSPGLSVFSRAEKAAITPLNGSVLKPEEVTKILRKINAYKRKHNPKR